MLTHNYSWLASKIITPISIFTKDRWEKGLKTTTLQVTSHYVLYIEKLQKNVIPFVKDLYDECMGDKMRTLHSWYCAGLESYRSLCLIEWVTTEWFIIEWMGISMRFYVVSIIINENKWLFFFCMSISKEIDYVAEWNINTNPKYLRQLFINQRKKRNKYRFSFFCTMKKTLCTTSP